MTNGRTVLKDWRVYIDGRDMSGYTRSFGPLACTFDEGIDDALTLAVKGTLLGNAMVSMGTLNGIYDNTAMVGLHAIMKGAGVQRNVMLACGIQAPPANNDPVFCGRFLQLGYQGDPGVNPVTASIPFGNSSAQAGNLLYAKPWGVLLHALAERTAANTAVGLDQLAETHKGGFMMYQITSADGAGNMTAAIKVQDADTNSDGSFGDLLSSGTINCVNGGVSGIVTLAKTATVKRYVRWQLALGTATKVTFALAFCRNYNS